MTSVSQIPRLQVAPSPETDLLLKLAFAFFVVDLFLVVSRFLEIITLAGGGRIPYLGVTLHVVTLMLAIVSGGAKRVVASKLGLSLALFTGWMMLCTLASTWRGGSVDTLAREWLPSLIVFIGCGTIATLQQLRKISTVIAAGTAIIAVASYALGVSLEDRLTLASGTLGNSNELSMLLLLGTPFFLVPVFSKGTSHWRWVVPLVLCAGALIIVIRSASRSNLIAIVVMLLVLFWTSTFAGKIKLGVLTVVLVLVFVAMVPREVLSRYVTIFGTAGANDEIAESAEESSLARQHLFQQSLKLTMEHPIFGLGPGIFAVGEADLAKSQGQVATWHVSHNSYTQVSSEMGIPGLLLYLAGMWFTFRNIFWIRAQSGKDPGGRASALGLAMLLSLMGLGVNLFFSSNAYFSYLPMLMGMSVAFRKSLQFEMSRYSLASVPQAPLPAPESRTTLPVKPAVSSGKPVYRFLGRSARGRV